MPPKRKTGPSDDGDPSSSSAPAVKRQRVSRACDQCRAAREKCDGIQPLCFPCASQNRSCTYDTSPKRRGVQAGYIRALEVALAWVFDKVPGSEDALQSMLGHEGGQGSSMLVGTGSGAGNRLHRRWLKSSVCSEIDKILSGGEPSRREPSKTATDDSSSEADGEADPPAGSGQTTAVPEQPSGESSDVTWRRPRLKLPSVHWQLLDIFFAYTHIWFPVVAKHDILKTSYSYPETGLEIAVDDPTSAAHAELWAVLALSSCQYVSSSGARESGAAVDPREVYQTARNLIPFENGPFSIHHVRALLLLCLVNLGGDNTSAAWILVGHAVRIAFQLGLGRPKWETTVEPGLRRVFVGCFVLDGLVARRMGCSPHLGESNLLTEPITAVDDGEEWQPWKPCDGFGVASMPRSYGPPCPGLPSSTFNMLYELCKYLFQTQPTELGASTAMETSHRPALETYQYREFVITGANPPHQLPSPYVLRLIYLAAKAGRGNDTDLFTTMLGHVNAYMVRYGSPAASPLFTTCLAIARSIGSENEPIGGDEACLEPTETSLRQTWQRANPASAPSVSVTTFRANGHQERSIVQPPYRDALPQLQMTSTPATKYDASMPLSPMLTRDRDTPIYSGIPSSLAFAHQDDGVQPQAGGGLAPGLPTAFSDMNTVLASPLLHTHENSILGRPPLDYDALLDDLAALDCTNQVDAESQFMLNLGFAPGADLTEFLTGDFGGMTDLSTAHILRAS